MIKLNNKNNYKIKLTNSYLGGGGNIVTHFPLK